MRLQVLAIGRLKAGPERDIAERYRGRAEALGRGLGFVGPSVIELLESRARRPEDRQADEAARMRDRIGPAALVVALDETASSPTSPDLAARLAGWRDGGRPDLAFVLGGADGLDPAFRAGAASGLGFGRMTLPHGLVRILLLEQVYRAFTILSGHPYHRGGVPE